MHVTLIYISIRGKEGISQTYKINMKVAFKFFFIITIICKNINNSKKILDAQILNGI